MKKEKSRMPTSKSDGYWLESLGLESSLYDVLVFHNHDGSFYNIYVEEDEDWLYDDSEETVNSFIHLNKMRR